MTEDSCRAMFEQIVSSCRKMPARWQPWSLLASALVIIARSLLYAGDRIAAEETTRRARSN